MSSKVKNTILGLQIYNIAVAVLYICPMAAVLILGLFESEGMGELLIITLLYALISVPFILIYLLGAYLAPKKTKNNWIFQIVLVAIGFTSILTMIPSIFLLIGLISDEVKNYYYKSAKDSAIKSQ